MGTLKITVDKVKTFRPTLLFCILFVFGTVRSAMDGSSIVMVGILAGIVPYMSVYKRWPEAPAGASRLQDAISSYLMSMILMLCYLGWMCLVGAIAAQVNPGYEFYSRYLEFLLLGMSTDVVFVCVMAPISKALAASVRLIPAIVLINFQIVFILLCWLYLPPLPIEGCFGCLVFMVFLATVTCGYVAMTFKEGGPRETGQSSE